MIPTAGLNSTSGERRHSAGRWVVWGALAAYALGFALLWPNAILVADEADYVGQATLFAHGERLAEFHDPFTSTVTRVPVSTYPIGTSAMQAPLVRLGGWRAAPLASLLALIGTVLLLMRWLELEERSPLFALLVLLYPPSLVLGRIGMSDVPSALVVTLGLLLFWLGLHGRRWAWLGAGFVAGASVLWREPNVLLFVPLFAGALLRRERQTWQLVAGGLAGLSLRLLSAWLIYGNATYLRSPMGYGFFTANTLQNFLVCTFALTVMAPGALPGLLLYRGRRRWELMATGLLFLAFYVSYGYSAAESGRLKQLILEPRYFIPLVPLLAFALAESLPRVWSRLRPQRFARGQLRTVGLALLGVVLLTEMAVAHVAVYQQGRARAEMQRVFYAYTTERAPIITNPMGAGKLASVAYGLRTLLRRDLTTPQQVVELTARMSPVYLAFIDRNDSPMLQADARENADFLAAVRSRCTVLDRYDRQETSLERLHIHEVTRCQLAAGTHP